MFTQLKPCYMCQDCEYEWMPVDLYGQMRPFIHAIGEVCPQCRAVQIISEDI